MPYPRASVAAQPKGLCGRTISCARMSSISDAPRLRLVTRRACARVVVSVGLAGFEEGISATHTRDAAEHEADAAEDDRADEREADLPREHRDVRGRDVHRGQQREQVREAHRDHVGAARGLRVGALGGRGRARREHEVHDRLVVT